MMNLDKNNSEFDLSLELLCLLPLPPALASVHGLRMDLGLNFESQVTDLCRTLKDNVCPVKTMKGKPDSYLCIEAHNWEAAQRAGIGYLKRMEPDSTLEPPVIPEKRGRGRPKGSKNVATLCPTGMFEAARPPLA